MSSSHGIVVVGDESPRDPNARCEACGTLGTLGRATRQDGRGGVVEEHRFCARCWPEESARYEARWQEERRLADEAWMANPEKTPPPPPGGMSFESATWHGVLRFVRTIQRQVHQTPPSRADLERMAADIVARAPEFEGPMPREIRSFVREYGSGK